eukprot:scaffold4.g4645.t1
MTIGDKVRAAADAVTGGRVSGTPATHERASGVAPAAGATGGYATGATERSGLASGATETRTETVPAGVVETTTTTQTPVYEQRTVATGAAQAVDTGRAAVCGQASAATIRRTEYYTKVEDRPAVIEKVERILEHRPVEKEFVVETRATGVERALPTTVEHLGTQERVVSEAAPRAPCE